MFLFESAVRGFSKDHPVTAPLFLGTGHRISRTPRYGTLLFGLWHQMVSRSQMFLWPDLAGAFPHAPNRAQRTVSDPVSRLRHFRNRIAHHHRIWALNGATRYQDILAVAGYIDPDLPGWIEKESTVQGLLSSQPC